MKIDEAEFRFRSLMVQATYKSAVIISDLVTKPTLEVFNADAAVLR